MIIQHWVQKIIALKKTKPKCTTNISTIKEKKESMCNKCFSKSASKESRNKSKILYEQTIVDNSWKSLIKKQYKEYINRNRSTSQRKFLPNKRNKINAMFGTNTVQGQNYGINQKIFLKSSKELLVESGELSTIFNESIIDKAFSPFKENTDRKSVV